MTTVVLALNSSKSKSLPAGKAARLMVAALLVVPLLAQADLVVLRDTVEGHVNIRIAPDGSAEVIGQLGHGEHLPYVQSHGHRWSEVRLGDGRAGFITQTWTEVIPDQLDHQTEVAQAESTDESVAVTSEVTSEPIVAQAPDESTEREEIVGPAALDTPEEIVEQKVSGPTVTETADRVVEDRVVDKPVVAEASNEVVEPETMDVPVVRESPEEADDPASLDEDVLAEDTAITAERATDPESTHEKIPSVVFRADPHDEEPVPLGGVTLSGTPNYVVKFTESTSGGNSNIFDDGINIGIGTSEPQQPLDVNGNIQLYNRNSNIAILTLTQATGNTGYIMHNLAGTMTIGAGSEDRITIDRNGNVGIGTNRPGHPLEMASGANVTAGGVWTNSSSAQYKENITELGLEEALATLAELSPVRFNYKVDEEDEYVGFIAEDVPDLVASKDRRGLSPMDIVAVLTRALQGQQKKIEELEARLDER